MRPDFSFVFAGFRNSGGLVRLGAAAALTLSLAAPASAESGNAKADYAIALSGYVIGRVNAELKINGDDYALSIDGYTNWLTSIVYKADATLASEGKISRGHVSPAKFDLSTTENGLSAKVKMLLRSGNIVALAANPELPDNTDRVPVRANHRRNVVDPASAFLVAVNHPSDFLSKAACNRTLHVFDGWQRFDISLFYKRAESVVSGSYSGTAVVCGATYKPVAGHRPSDAVKEMQANSTLEVWLAPLEDLGVMIPYNIVIGTKFGDLSIRANNLTSVSNSTQASTQ